MKLGVSITAFREKHIVPIIKQYEGIADKIVVSVSKKPWFGNLKPDDTARRAVEETSACVISKPWDNEADQRNETMEYMRDMDYIIVSHCDTWFERRELELLKHLNDLTDLHYGCYVRTYWKNYNTVIYPHLGLPTILVRSDARFTHMINIQDQSAEPECLPVFCHHVAWVKTDEEIKEKIGSYSHANEISGDWYNNVWKKWKSDMENFGITKPEDFKKAVKGVYTLPKEIQLWLEY